MNIGFLELNHVSCENLTSVLLFFVSNNAFTTASFMLLVFGQRLLFTPVFHCYCTDVRSIIGRTNVTLVLTTPSPSALFRAAIQSKFPTLKKKRKQEENIMREEKKILFYFSIRPNFIMSFNIRLSRMFYPRSIGLHN